MSNRHRYYAGAAAALVYLASLLVFMSGVQLQGAVRVLLFALSATSLLIFVSALVGIMRMEPDFPGWLSTAALGGGIASLTIQFVQLAIGTVAARPGLATEIHDMLHQLDGALFFASFFPLSVLVLGAGLSALRRPHLPRWFGWVSLFTGILLIAGAVLGMTQDNGIAFLLYLLWLLLAGVALLLKARKVDGIATATVNRRIPQSG